MKASVTGCSPQLVDEIRNLALQKGLNLLGLVAAEEFDGCQPAWCRASDHLAGCGTVVVLGSGGSELWRETRRGREVGVPSHGEHPIREHCSDSCEQLMETLQASGLVCDVVYPHERHRCGRPRLNFLQLGEMAGLGTISPVIGLLLHPQYGPWISLQAAILVEGLPFGMPEKHNAAAYQPCLRCSKPCIKACPARVYDGNGNVDVSACGDSRSKGPCISHCDVRRACPEGAEYRYGPEQESFRHAHATLALRKHLGRGWWKMVPRAWR